MPIDHVSVPTAARMLGVHQSTFRRWIHEGRVDVVRYHPKGPFRVPRSSVDQLLRTLRASLNTERIH